MQSDTFFVLIKQDFSTLHTGDKLELDSRYIQVVCGDGMITLDIYESPDIFEILN